MVQARNRLDRQIDPSYDHVLGPDDAPISLVEYGSYACPHCRAAHEVVQRLRERLGDRLLYVFRQRPISGNELARPAAELAEQAPDPDTFWRAHVELMTRSPVLSRDDLETIAAQLGLNGADEQEAKRRRQRARERVDADVRSAAVSGVRLTPTFFINGRPYDGPWDESSLEEAICATPAYRVRSAAVNFADWAPSTGVLLLLMTILAIALTNSPAGPAFQSLWHLPVGLELGDAAFRLPLLQWINDGVLTLFFLVVGLEVKRELTVGRLASPRAAALPIAAAIGGLVVPAALYLLIIPPGPWTIGAGVPMPTDTAFAVALIVMLGRRVPIELRVFLTAAAIVDDIGAISVVAIFYSTDLQAGYLLAALGIVAGLILLNLSSIERPWPYALLGIVLWACLHAGGVHATMTGVLLSFVIPTRPPPNLTAMLAQAQAAIDTESRPGEAAWHLGPSERTLRTLDAIHNRVQSPSRRMLRTLEPRSSYVVLPLFALANAGVVLSADVFEGREMLALAIATGLVIGKPLGFVLASLLVVRLGLAEKPSAYSWRQLVGAGFLAGIGFTMSLFIATEAFPDPADFEVAKLTVFGASALSAIIGIAVLWQHAPHATREARREATEIA